jgi:glycosyltransferase involved in cell wall biosynthesis
MPQLRVGLFTEVYHPIVNGVVASIDALRAGLRNDDVDVVTFAPHAHAYIDDVDARIVRFPSLPLPTSTGYRFCIPYLRNSDRMLARELDVVHAHSPFVSGWFAAAHARRMKIPFIYTYHTQLDAYAHYAPVDARMTRVAMRRLTRVFANRADIVIAPTHAMRERLRELGVVTRIEVVPSAIDDARFANGRRNANDRARLGANDCTRVIIAVARLGREKNLGVAIDALAALDDDVALAIVGDGPQRDELERRVDARGLRERVRFLGRIAPAEMPDLYASADGFVFTSLTDTQGLVLSEAQAAGLAVAAIESPVAREILGAGGTYAANDAGSLAAALRAIVDAPRPGPLAGARFGIGEHAASVRRLYQTVR